MATTEMVPAAVAPIRPYVLRVGLSGTTVTMPSRLHAGTYVVHASTSDIRNQLQVVRPPSTLSRSSFVARWRAWWFATGANVSTTWYRWRTSATFVGGADVVPRSVSGPSRTPGGLGTFAITLRPGTYWFYTGDRGGDLRAFTDKVLEVPASHIRVVTVYGTAPAQYPVPVAGTARFGDYTVAGKRTSVSLPANLPAHGYLRGIGTSGYVSTWGLQKLQPGVTADRLVPGDCYPDGGGAWNGAPDCFEPPRYQLGGGVSAGSAALWWYSVPPGRYAVFQASHGVGGYDFWPRDRGLVTIVTFS